MLITFVSRLVIPFLCYRVTDHTTTCQLKAVNMDFDSDSCNIQLKTVMVLLQISQPWRHRSWWCRLNR